MGKGAIYRNIGHPQRVVFLPIVNDTSRKLCDRAPVSVNLLSEHSRISHHHLLLVESWRECWLESCDLLLHLLLENVRSSVTTTVDQAITVFVHSLGYQGYPWTKDSIPKWQWDDHVTRGGKSHIVKKTTHHVQSPQSPRVLSVFAHAVAA